MTDAAQEINNPLKVSTPPSVKSGDLWTQSLAALREELDSQVFEAYIKPLHFKGFNQDTSELSLAAPSRLICKHVEENFRSRLEQVCTVRSGAGRPVTVRVVVDSPRSAEKAQPAERLAKSPTPYVVVKKIAPAGGMEDGSAPLFSSGSSWNQTSSNGLNPKYTFSNFIVGNNSQFCHAAAMRVAEEPGMSYNPLFIYGGVGLGKTHLLHAIGNEVLQRNPRARVLYMSSESFTNELIHSLRLAKMDAFKNKLRNINVLLIDDIQFMAGKERTQEEFFHTFNTLYGAKNQIVMTSDKLPQDTPGIEDRLRTRFSWGLTADLQAPDFETRVAILRRKATADGYSIPEDVAHLIAQKISSNVRELEGALTRLHAMSSLQKLPINLALASNALRELLQPKVVNISVSDIKETVSHHFRIKVADIISKRRTRNLSFPRHIAMYLCRKHTTASYPEIGNNFGNRDHSSVIHAANVVAEKVKSDPEVLDLIGTLERKLFEGR